MITKQQLGNFLWGMADILYGKVEDYKSYILTLLFYKRLSDNYTWEESTKVTDFKDKYGKQPNTKQLEQITKYAHQFIIPQGCFWDDVKQAPLDKKNELMQKACDEIANSNKLADGTFPLKGIINAVRWNEAAPDGSGRKRLDPSILQDLINYLDPMNFSNNRVPLDILGHAYEYLIKRFADENKGGTVAGQFYTPPEIVELMVRTMKPDGTWRNDNEFYMDEKFGKVPVNWVIDRIKSFGEVVTGKTPPTDNQDNFSNSIGYMFITPGDIGEGIFINKAERYLSSSDIKYSYKIPANSVSFVSIGSTIGKVAITTEDSCSNQQINTIAGTTATPQINKSDLSKIKIAKPATYDTQKMIGEKIFFVDNQKTLKYLKIQKLEKLKKSLMQKLLTGQVRAI